MTSAIQTPPSAGVELLDHILPLPTLETVLAQPTIQRNTTHPWALSSFDGLLAALFTTPSGPRAATLEYLLTRQATAVSSVAQQKIHAVAQRIQRWKALLQRTLKSQQDWIADLLQDYDPESPQAPFLTKGDSQHDITAVMTLDPSFSYAFRSAMNTGQLTQKTNVALRGTRYAALLALIGAARCLRAQYLSQDFLNLYVPLARTWRLHAETSLPCLLPSSVSPDHAFVWQWLSLTSDEEHTWQGIAFQTLQRQGRQQSITWERGVLLSHWRDRLEQHVGKDVLLRWRAWLSQPEKSPLTLDEQQHLIDCLKYQRGDAWFQHLCDLASHYHHNYQTSLRTYTIEEVKEITTMMHQPASPISHPLRAIVERKEGTCRFGHALRQLGRFNPAIVRDLVEVLEPVTTLEQLLLVLHQIVHECELASTRNRFSIVPTDEDFAVLLNDVQQHGVRSIVGMLLVLSALRYPRSEEIDRYSISTLINLLLLLLCHTHQEITPDAASSDLALETIASIPEDVLPLEGDEAHDYGTSPPGHL